MLRSAFSVVLGIIVFCTACSQKEQQESRNPPVSQPNIILFVSDDHGTDAVGCYGNPVIKTPNMDLLADEGVRFTNAYCTSASCAASRSVILTGKFGHATGSYGHTHDYHHFSTYPEVRSLPVILEESGYHTARIGKYHLAPESVYDFKTVLEENERSTVKMAEKCKNVIESEKPFFLYFCTGDPHRSQPFQPENWDDPNGFGNREEGYPGVNSETYSTEEVLVPSFLPDNKQSREELAAYYQSVSRIDQGLGRLVEMLKESGKYENTIILYISDNGIAFPGAKTTLYEPGIRLPCIIRDPASGEKGVVNETRVSWVDLVPTLLDRVGIEKEEEGFHGKSFADILDDPSKSQENNIYASHTFHEITMYYPMRSIISGDYKLIWNAAYQLPYPFASDLWASSTWQSIYRNKIENFGKRSVDTYMNRDEFELFNLKKDPDEAVNLAQSIEHSDMLALMQEKLKNYQRETKDPWLILWEHDASLQGTGVGL